MKRGFLITLLVAATVLFIPQKLWAQYVVTKADTDRANELKEQFDEAEVVAASSDINFTFDWDKKEGLLVRQAVEEEVICLKEDNYFNWYTFFDEQSRVDRMEVFYPNGKKDTRSKFKQDYYQSDMYFYTDAMVGYVAAYYNKFGEARKFEYDKTFMDVKYLTSVYFQEHYPINERKISFTIPRWMEVELLEMNFDSFGIVKEKTYLEAEDADHYTYTIQNLDAVESEYAAPGPSHTRPHLLVLSKGYTHDNEYTRLFAGTEDLYKWYSTLVKSLSNDPTATKELVQELITGKVSEEDKIRSIYYWVQHNIRYIAFEDGIAGFKPDESHNVFEKKYGDCKGMANLTKEMLRTAGFDARLAWIGTKRLNYDYSIPSMAVDNHMICALNFNDNWYFLDPTEKFGAFGEYSERIQGKEVMIEDGDAYIIEQVPATSVEQNLALVRITLRVEGELLKGSAEHIYKGESRTNMLIQLDRIESKNLEEALTDYIRNDDKNFNLENLETSDLNNQDSTLHFTYSFTWENAVSAFGNEIYLDLDFYKDFKNYEMEDERKSDYVFDYKIQEETQIELEIPEGYSINYRPQDLEKIHPDFSFVINFQQEGSKLLYNKRIQVNRAIIHKEDFKAWNNGVQELIGRYSEQIILAKP